jgi:hypothetical protein
VLFNRGRFVFVLYKQESSVLVMIDDIDDLMIAIDD